LAPFLRILVNNWYGEQLFQQASLLKDNDARSPRRRPQRVSPPGLFHRRRYEGDQKIDPEDQAGSQ
jgi:hypothetical protein